MGIKDFLMIYLGMIPFSLVISSLIIWFMEDFKKFIYANTKTKIGMIITLILGILIVISKVTEGNR